VLCNKYGCDWIALRCKYQLKPVHLYYASAPLLGVGLILDESNVKPNESLKSSFTKELLNQKLSGQFETTKEESNDKDYKYVPNPKSISLDDGSDTTTDEKVLGTFHYYEN